MKLNYPIKVPTYTRIMLLSVSLLSAQLDFEQYGTQKCNIQFRTNKNKT